MSHVVKVIELVGSSPNSWDEAVRNAVSVACETLRGVTGVDVQDWTADVRDGKITAYKANVKIAFVVEHGAGGSPGSRPSLEAG